MKNYIKQKLTDERANRVETSLQYLYIMTSAMLLEHQQDMDVDFRIPMINNFGNRIRKDIMAIREHLATSGKVTIREKHRDDFAAEYAAALHNIIIKLVGVPIEDLEHIATQI